MPLNHNSTRKILCKLLPLTIPSKQQQNKKFYTTRAKQLNKLLCSKAQNNMRSPLKVSILLAFMLSTFLGVTRTSCFTIILPDSPNDLVDTPQKGMSTNMDRAHTDPGEQRAVYEIMVATGNGWATSIADVCKGRWHGIECMPDQQNILHVVSLSFGALSDDTAFPTCSPNAYISSAINNLPHLKRLFFYQCCTNNPQPIPKEIGNLGNSLESLVLRENGHVGSIPMELGNLSKLHTLDLHGNKLTSIIPSSLSTLSHLQLLDLSSNKLAGEIPRLDMMSRINVMSLHQNFLSGHIPESIGCLSSLVKLDLSKNRLRGPIPSSLGNLKNLILLDVGYNMISGLIPRSLGDLKLLQALILQGNSFESPIPDALGGMDGLNILASSNAGLVGSIPHSLGSLKKLRVLCLDGNKLNGSIPKSLTGLHVNELKINGNFLSGKIPFKREFIWSLGRRLQMGDNPGLCYEPSSSSEEEMDSSFLVGIKLCNNHFTRTTGHVSVISPSSYDHIFSSSQPLESAFEQSLGFITCPCFLLFMVLTTFLSLCLL